MAVFNGSYLDICVLIDQPGADIMTEEHIGYRHRAASVRYPDLGTNAAILHSSFDQLFCPGWAIDVDWLRTLAIPRQGHEGTEACCVIVVMVRNKNRSDLPDIYTRLRNTAAATVADTVAGINNIIRVVNGQKIGRLHPVRSQRRTRRRAERDERR